MSDSPDLYSHAATVLPVGDLVRSRDFYRDVLGFSVDFEWEDPPSYAVLHAGESVQIHLSLHDCPTKSDRRPTMIYLFVHDVDSLYAAISGRGARILGAPETFDYGMREFELADPDGHRLVFGQGV